MKVSNWRILVTETRSEQLIEMLPLILRKTEALNSVLLATQDKYFQIEYLYREINGHLIAGPARKASEVYGELSSIYIYTLLFAECKNFKKESPVFCDLGSGLGKAISAASLYRSRVNCIGIEMNKRLYKVSLALSFIMNKAYSTNISLYNEDVLNTLNYWKHSDIVFLNALTWGKSCVGRLVNLFKFMKRGTEIVSSVKLNSSVLKLRTNLEVKASWGSSTFYIYYIAK